jgi:hypothetical protein
MFRDRKFFPILAEWLAENQGQEWSLLSLGTDWLANRELVDTKVGQSDARNCRQELNLSG